MDKNSEEPYRNHPEPSVFADSFTQGAFIFLKAYQVQGDGKSCILDQILFYKGHQQDQWDISTIWRGQ